MTFLAFFLHTSSSLYHSYSSSSSSSSFKAMNSFYCKNEYEKCHTQAFCRRRIELSIKYYANAKITS
jgi:hypothetical protein